MRIPTLMLVLSLVLVFGPSAVIAPAGASFADLPAPLQQAIRAQGLPDEAVGLWVKRVGDPAPMLRHNSQQRFNPASTIKLATTLAALKELGPSHVWTTEVYATAPVRDGVLRGNLVLRGTGDPGMVSEEHWRMLGALRRGGLRRIEGNVYLDTSHFYLPVEDPAAFDGQPLRAYNQAPHALIVNANALRWHVVPEANGGSIRVVPDPPLPGLQVVNRLRSTQGSCGGWQRGIRYEVENDTAGARVIFSGEYPVNCGEYELLRTAVSPEVYNRELFRLHWSQWGGELTGDVRYGVLSLGNGRPLLEHHSRPLGEIIRVANKWSSNVVARHLALTLSVERFGAPATVEKSREALYVILAGLGVEVGGMIIDNGSGLSRHTRISPEQLGQVLQAGWESPWRPEFVSSLAIAGVDGTMRRRFNAAPETGRMHLKSGHLNQVSAVAGYVRNQSNEDVMVVLLINHPTAHQGAGSRLQEAVLRWVHDL